MPDLRAAAVIVAAGKSRRMGGGRNKALQSLGGRPILSYSLEVFQCCDGVSIVTVVGREEDREEVERIMERYCPKASGHFVPGGCERFESVKNGLAYLSSHIPDAVLIQDAARPFLRENYIQDSLQALREVSGCVVGVPLKDTLKETNASARVTATRDRSQFWLAQTPQTFQYSVILEAYRSLTPPPYPTDDGEVLEFAGQEVLMIPGSYQNMKITTPEDIPLAEAVLQMIRHEVKQRQSL